MGVEYKTAVSGMSVIGRINELFYKWIPLIGL